MVDEGNAQLSAVGFFNPMLGGGEAVAVSGGTGGSVGGVFDIEDSKVVRCALAFGRQWIQCNDTSLDILKETATPRGIIYAEIDHSSSSSLTLAVKHTDGELPDNSLQKSYRALYYAYKSTTAGEQTMTWADVRFQPTMFAMN